MPESYCSLVNESPVRSNLQALWSHHPSKRGASMKQMACQIVSAKEQSFTIPGCGWVNADANGTGYYVASYANGDFEELTEAVNELTPAERMSFYDDTWRMITAGRQPIGEGLTLATDLRNERGPVLETVIGTLDDIEERLVTEEDRPEFQQWLRNLLDPVLNEIGWTPKEGEPDDIRSLRPRVIEILGRRANDPHVVAKCHELAQSYMKDATSVRPDLVDAVLMAAAHGNEQLYDQYVAHMQAAKTPSVYYAYFEALSGFTAPQLVQRTLDLALSSEVRSQDMEGPFFDELANPASQRVAWEYVKAHYDQIIKSMPVEFDEAYIAQMVWGFCDAGMRDDAMTLLSAKLAGHPQRLLNEAVDKINNCIAAKDTQAPQLAQWLRQNAAAGER
jgi:hypothetical protein